jgi:hypothetical protein
MPACLQVAALENQLASSIAAASGGGSRAAVGSPFAVPAFGEAGGLLRRSLDSGIKTKTTLRLEEDGGLRGGIIQRQSPRPLFSMPLKLPCVSIPFPSHPPFNIVSPAPYNPAPSSSLPPSVTGQQTSINKVMLWQKPTAA